MWCFVYSLHKQIRATAVPRRNDLSPSPPLSYAGVCKYWVADVFPSSLLNYPLCFGFKAKLSQTWGPRESRTRETQGETLRAWAYYQKEFECSQQPSSKLESFGSQEWVVLFVPAYCSCSSLSLPTPRLWVVYYTQATNEWEPLFYSTPHLQDLSLGLPQIWLINSRAPPS